MPTDPLSDIRDLLYTPSDEHWERLCNALDGINDPAVLDQIVLPYCQHHLKAWPGELRQVPRRWLARGLRGEPVPGLSIAHRLSIKQERMSVQDIKTLCGVSSWASLRHLQLTDVRFGGAKGLGTLMDSTLFAGLRALELCAIPLTGKPFEALLAHPALAAIESRTFRKARLNAHRLEQMLTAANFGEPTHLDFQNNTLDAECAEALADIPALRGLRTLNLNTAADKADFSYLYNSIGPEGTQALAHSPYLGALTRLQLNYNELTTAGLVALANSPVLGGLTHLELRGNKIALDGFLSMARASWLSKLDTLDLSFNAIGARGSRTWLLNTALPSVKTLNLSGLRLGVSGIKTLIKTLSTSPVAHLKVASNQLKDSGFRPLADSDLMGQLESLDASFNQLNDSVAALVQNPDAVRLHTLNLSNNDLPDDVVVALATSPIAHNLRHLDLTSNRGLTDKAFFALARSKALSGLASLRVDTWNMSKDARRALANSKTLPETIALGFA